MLLKNERFLSILLTIQKFLLILDRENSDEENYDEKKKKYSLIKLKQRRQYKAYKAYKA